MTRTIQIDRMAWSRLLAEMMAAAGTSIPEAAELSGSNSRTLHKWMGQEREVTAESVLAVARALGYPPVRALVEVGFLLPDEAPAIGLANRPALDPLARDINGWLRNPRIPASVKGIFRKGISAQFNALIDAYRAGAGPKEPSQVARARGEQVQES